MLTILPLGDPCGRSAGINLAVSRFHVAGGIGLNGRSNPDRRAFELRWPHGDDVLPFMILATTAVYNSANTSKL